MFLVFYNGRGLANSPCLFETHNKENTMPVPKKSKAAVAISEAKGHFHKIADMEITSKDVFKTKWIKQAYHLQDSVREKLELTIILHNKGH